MNIEDRVTELEKRMDKIEGKQTVNETVIAARKAIVEACGYSYDGLRHNFYHRTCKQLQKHLINNNVPVKLVSRSSVGDIDFYNLRFELTTDEFMNKITDDWHIADILGIKGVGLVRFDVRDHKHYMTILINEKELNDKYLKDGNLDFNQNL